jgi:hypothetical protein
VYVPKHRGCEGEYWASDMGSLDSRTVRCGTLKHSVARASNLAHSELVHKPIAICTYDDIPIEQ